MLTLPSQQSFYLLSRLVVFAEFFFLYINADFNEHNFVVGIIFKVSVRKKFIVIADVFYYFFFCHGWFRLQAFVPGMNNQDVFLQIQFQIQKLFFC